MTFLDKAKATAGRAREQATHGLETGRTRLEGPQARRKYSRLLHQLGEAYFAEHQGKGTREAVTRLIGELEAHVKEHPGTTPEAVLPTRLARDIMHRGAECITEDDTLTAAAEKMRDLGVGSLPICGADDRLHGIITDRDIVVRCIAEGGDPAEVRAGDLAQEQLFWVEASADLDAVLREMEDHRVKRMPVIENHRLVGVISEADLARYLTEHRLAEFVESVYATA
jgi:CBS domain-containing protein